MTAKKISVILAVTFSVWAAIAGTLDNAPFRVILPDSSWTLDDSSAKDMGKSVYLVASITSTNTQSRSVVIRADIDPPSATALADLCDGIRDGFSNPALKKLYDQPTVFLGRKAQCFIYEVNGSTYNETIVFVDGNTGWTIGCSGLLDQKAETAKLITFYQKK
jgi:hypothetical protein